nr:SDR family oxidoreductase [Pseudonocardia acidicola]
MAGRRIAVTGGSSGIGAAVAAELRARGARVGIIGRNAERLAAVADATGAVPRAADVADHGAVRSAVEGLAEELDGLDGLVNNAGAMLHSRVSEGRVDDWSAVVGANVLGVLHASSAAIPFLRKAARQGPADLMTVTSAGADRVTRPEFAVYMGSKAAARHITEGLRLELAGDLVRVSMVSPGTTDTEGHGPGIADPELRQRVMAQKASLGLRPTAVAAQVAAVLALPPGVSIRHLEVRPFPGD